MRYALLLVLLSFVACAGVLSDESAPNFEVVKLQAITKESCLTAAHEASRILHPGLIAFESDSEIEMFTEEHCIVTLVYGHTRPPTRTWWLCSTNYPVISEIGFDIASQYIDIKRSR